MSAPGELHAALRDNYRVAVQERFFPYVSTNPNEPGTVHAVVDHGARAIFCSREWFDALRRGES